MEFFSLLFLTSLVATSEISSAEPELLIIDTDGGGDDAEAILLALSDKRKAKVLAISCCFGNTNLDNACSNVLRILTLTKEDEIPVYRGSEGPLIESNNHMRVFGADGFGNVANEFSTGHLTVSNIPAVLELIDLTKRYPGRINLIAIGPLTNIALAHKTDPGFTLRLKSLFIMGGNYRRNGSTSEMTEFNFSNDPESAHIILSETRCPTTMVPWETVSAFGMPWDFFNNLTSLRTPKAHFLKRINEFYEAYFYPRSKRYCDCDFQAISALLYPESIASSVYQALTVELGGCSGKRGRTIPYQPHQQMGDYRKTPKYFTDRPIKIITAFNTDVLNELRYKMVM